MRKIFLSSQVSSFKLCLPLTQGHTSLFLNDRPLVQKMKTITVFVAFFGKCLLTYRRVVANVKASFVTWLQIFHLGVAFTYLALASLNFSGRALFSFIIICQIISFANKLRWKRRLLNGRRAWGTRERPEDITHWYVSDSISIVETGIMSCIFLDMWTRQMALLENAINFYNRMCSFRFNSFRFMF